MAWSRAVYILLFLLISVNTYSQSAPLTYVITFTNKGNSPYTLTNPTVYLSQRSLDRRSRAGISLDSTDLPVSPAYITALDTMAGVNVVGRSKWFNNASVMLADTGKLQGIRNLPFVLSIKCTHSNKPGISKYANKYNTQRLTVNEYLTPDTLAYGFSANQVKMMNGQFLHQMGFTGDGMYIAVIDNGFLNVDVLPYYQHARSAGKFIYGPDFVQRDHNLNNNGTHGTLVMSCMAPYSPGEFIGTAPDASYFMCITENDTSEYLAEEDYWIMGAEWADSSGADILNTSLGYKDFDDTTMNHTFADLNGNTTRITRGVNMATAKGMLSVNSAGNAGGAGIGAPADAINNLSVGAVGPDSLYALFSSVGPTADGRIKPDVSAQGFLGFVIWPDEAIGMANGTSFSGPTMAGMAACLWQAFPEKTNMEIRAAIMQSATQYHAPDNLLGSGIPDMEKAYWILRNEYRANDLHILVKNNPFIDRCIVHLYSPNQTTITFELFDITNATGKRVSEKTVTLKPNEPYDYLIDANDCLLAAGVYALRLSNEKGVVTIRLVKQ